MRLPRPPITVEDLPLSGDIMPPAQFSPADMQVIVNYLFSLPVV
jgi:hypothetical protein